MATATVGPVRRRTHSEELDCDVLELVGFDARCTCGWAGKVRRQRRDAELDKVLHLGEQHARPG